jgi:hypothetical protein
MEIRYRYRGRDVTDEDIVFIRRLIAAHPETSRRALSKELCVAWNWVQPNGQPRDMVCRGLMLGLHRAGLIELPAARWVPPNNLVERRRPLPVAVDTTPLGVTLREIQPLEIRQVRRSGHHERLFNALIEDHHYLGYSRPVGEHLKYVIYAGERPIAGAAFSSSPRHLGPRDRFIGWSAEARRQNIRFLAYNTRFLILPWIEVPYLASHLLGRLAKLLPGDWQRIYGHPIYYLETFIDPGRFRGTCYRAANWAFLGRTTGRGKDDQTHRANRSLKEVLGYPLTKRFRELLSRVG